MQIIMDCTLILATIEVVSPLASLYYFNCPTECFVWYDTIVNPCNIEFTLVYCLTGRTYIYRYPLPSSSLGGRDACLIHPHYDDSTCCLSMLVK